MQGVKVIAISKSGIQGTELVLSNEFDEQEKIGDFLYGIDEKIKNNELKLEKLKVLKKSMLSKMFPRKGEKRPEIRFAGYSEEWDEQNLGTVLSLLKDGTHATHKDVEKGVYLLSAKNIKNGQIIIDDSDRQISESDYEKIHSHFKLKRGDVLMTIVGTIGDAAILENDEGVTFQRSVAFLRPNEELHNLFLFYSIATQDFQKELDSRKSISAQPGIYLGEVEQISIRFPKKIDEQKQIAEYFRCLDELIYMNEKELIKLKNIKVACMKRMFV